MFHGRVEGQQPLPVAVDQRAGSDHLRVQPRAARQAAPELAAEAVRPVHHGRGAEAPGVNRGFLLLVVEAFHGA